VAEPALEVHHLAKSYGSVRAVVDVTLTAPAGAVTAVLGPNGAGKTTTLEVCEGYRRADSGAVRVLGLDPVRDARALKARVGVMLQAGGVASGTTAAEALAHHAALYARPLDPVLLGERLGLAGLGRRPVRRMSGGEQRRLALALAVVGRPELVILDEPTTGLDPQARLAAWELVRELRDRGVSVVLSTHLMEEAERLADAVVVIDAGATIASGSVAELVGDPAVRRLTVRARAGLPTAELLGLLAGAEGAEEAGPGTYVVQGRLAPDAAAVAGQWCAAHGCEPTEVSLRGRTLEDVFLDLTGRELRP